MALGRMRGYVTLKQKKKKRKTKDWFTMPLRGRAPEDMLGSLCFIPTPHEKPTFDPTVMMRRYVDVETIKEWDRDGTTMVRGMMN